MIAGGRLRAAVIAAVLTAVCAVTGVSWVLVEHRRVENREGLGLRDPQGH
ncbi:hypothetical protein [Nocardia stercoris]|nr:hypothetical protein [Nocardia stercoris]